jgi:hypothetical protein
MRDWNAEPVKEILPLIPMIRDNRVEINPPSESYFVLRIGSSYFVRFHHVLPGPCISPNVAKAARLDNLVIAASFALFIKTDLPTLKETLFVEAVPKNGLTVKTPVQEKPKARAVSA